MARSAGDRCGELNALIGLGQVHLVQSRYTQAAETFAEARDSAAGNGLRSRTLDVLLGLGRVGLAQGRAAEAEFRRAREIAQEIGHTPGAVRALSGLEVLHGRGRLHHAAGRHPEALAHHQQALDLATDLGQAGEQARAHDGPAHAGAALGRPEEARRHWRRALSILTALGSEGSEEAEVTAMSIRAHLGRLDTRLDEGGPAVGPGENGHP